MPDPNPSDEEDFLALQAGDPTALNRLIERWQRPLHSFAFRYCQNRSDAEDLVAQAFVRLYHHRKRLRHDTRLSAWLFTTLTNLCRNHHRWKTRHPAAGANEPLPSSRSRESTLDRLTSADKAPNEQLEQDETLTAVQQAIAQLPHELKVALLLHHYDQLSYREIGAITGCSERGVETRLYRARQRLRDSLSIWLRKVSQP